MTRCHRASWGGACFQPREFNVIGWLVGADLKSPPIGGYGPTDSIGRRLASQAAARTLRATKAAVRCAQRRIFHSGMSSSLQNKRRLSRPLIERYRIQRRAGASLTTKIHGNGRRVGARDCDRHVQPDNSCKQDLPLKARGR